MQAIEFEAKLKDGMIQLPLSYQHWQEGQAVKVIVQVADNAPDYAITLGQNINRHAGKINLTQYPLTFQDALRDEWV